MIKLTVNIKQFPESRSVGVLIDAVSDGQILPEEMLSAKVLYDALIKSSENMKVLDPDIKPTDIVDMIGEMKGKEDA